MTFGEKAVGLNFNPSGDPVVHDCKQEFARVIDRMDELRATDSFDSNREVARMASLAITYAQIAQMWAVKALTWKD